MKLLLFQDTQKLITHAKFDLRYSIKLVSSVL